MANDTLKRIGEFVCTDCLGLPRRSLTTTHSKWIIPCMPWRSL